MKKVNKAQSKINKETEGTITEKVALDKEMVFELFDEYHAKCCWFGGGVSSQKPTTVANN